MQNDQPILTTRKEPGREIAGRMIVYGVGLLRFHVHKDRHILGVELIVVGEPDRMSYDDVIAKAWEKQESYWNEANGPLSEWRRVSATVSSFDCIGAMNNTAIGANQN